MAIEYFNAYHSYLKSIEPLNDAERGRLFTALLEYSMTGEVPDVRGNERFIFPTMKEQIDRDKQKYDAKCKKQAEKAKKRWDADACHGMPEHAEGCQAMPNDADDAKEKAKEKTKEKTKEKAKEKDNNPQTPLKGARFTPPTVDEVAAYCFERANGIDAQHFVDYYAQQQWKLSNGNKMADWKAAVRTWENRDRRKSAGKDGNSYRYMPGTGKSEYSRQTTSPRLEEMRQMAK